MHVPSFLVGSFVSGSGFLFIHKELSHRERLTTKWALLERAQKEFNVLWTSAKANVSTKPKVEPDVGKYVNDAVDKWSDGVSQVRNFVGKK